MSSLPLVRARVLGAAALVSPALLLLSTIVSVLGGGLAFDQPGGILQVWAMAGFFLAFAGVAALVEPRMPRAAALLLLVGAAGSAGGVAYGINTIYATLGEVNLNLNVDGLAGIVALKGPGLFFPAALLTAGASLFLAHVGPRWTGLALIVAAVLFPVSRIGSIDLLAPVPDVLVLLGFAPAGLALLAGGASEPRRANAPARAGA
ncbi:MAG: hypothetical protein AB7G21_03315 [Dehalococcoidia bacterium]